MDIIIQTYCPDRTSSMMTGTIECLCTYMFVRLLWCKDVFELLRPVPAYLPHLHCLHAPGRVRSLPPRESEEQVVRCWCELGDESVGRLWIEPDGVVVPNGRRGVTDGQGQPSTEQPAERESTIIRHRLRSTAVYRYIYMEMYGIVWLSAYAMGVTVYSSAVARS